MNKIYYNYSYICKAVPLWDCFARLFPNEKFHIMFGGHPRLLIYCLALDILSIKRVFWTSHGVYMHVL